MTVRQLEQPGITAAELEEPAWLVRRRRSVAHLPYLGGHPATATPLNDRELDALWRGVRAEQGR